MIQRIIRNNRGLTLIEVLLSITILGIIATSFLSFFNQAYSYTKKNEDKTVGINVARNVLNYFEQQNFANIKDTYLTISDFEDLKIENCDDKIPGDSNEYVFDDPEVCESFFTTTINNVDYTSKIRITEGLVADGEDASSKPDLKDQLVGVRVEVNWVNQPEPAVVKGLIKK